MINIYEQIKILCVKKGLSISQLEKKAGLGNGSIRNWEKYSPLVSSVMKVAEALEIPLEEFLIATGIDSTDGMANDAEDKRVYSRPNVPAVIYAIRCTENGRIYIGSSTNLDNRLKTHFRDLKAREKRGAVRDENGKSKGIFPEGSLWQEDFNKYGEKAFEIYVLEEDVPKRSRQEREDYWIEEYKACDPEHGYNQRRERLPKFKIQKGLPPKS